MNYPVYRAELSLSPDFADILADQPPRLPGPRRYTFTIFRDHETIFAMTGHCGELNAEELIAMIGRANTPQSAEMIGQH